MSTGIYRTFVWSRLSLGMADKWPAVADVNFNRPVILDHVRRVLLCVSEHLSFYFLTIKNWMRRDTNNALSTKCLVSKILKQNIYPKNDYKVDSNLIQ